LDENYLLLENIESLGPLCLCRKSLEAHLREGNSSWWRSQSQS